jgi:hypothetical protein
MQDGNLLEGTISEYKSLIPPKGRNGSSPIISEHLVAELTRNHDWTEEGARAALSLATDYGTFILRNALALAIVLDIEDGALGF